MNLPFLRLFGGKFNDEDGLAAVLRAHALGR
jgi:hypothetical protein